ncbi:MAG: glycosyltransferase family 2 protein [Chitinophagales bacterium]
MSKLSVVIITFNEEERMGRCIDSVRQVADEIIVLDSFSTDRTLEIARAKGALVFQEKFTGFTAQKNRVIAKSIYPYVFSIDADEELSEDLLRSIQSEKEKGFPAGAYQMNRLNFFGKRAVKTCGWYPDTKVRIWNKTMGHWTGGLVHEEWAPAQSAVVVEKLKGDLLHFTYQTKEDLIRQTERFADLAAESLRQKNIFYLLTKMLTSPWFKFMRSYFFKLGFTDGALGFTICYYQSRGVFLKYYRAIISKQ